MPPNTHAHIMCTKPRACMLTQTHALAHVYTKMHMNTQACATHMYTCTCIHPHTRSLHEHIHAWYARTCLPSVTTHAYMRIMHIHKCITPYTPTHAFTAMHTQTYKCLHTHVYKHTQHACTQRPSRHRLAHTLCQEQVRRRKVDTSFFSL